MLESMQTEDSFTLFFKLVNGLHEIVGKEPPVLSRTWKSPQQYEIGSGEGSRV